MLARLFGKSEVRAQATTWGTWAGDTVPTWAGPGVTSMSATQLLTVYGCVRLIADQISTFPTDVYRRVGDTMVEETTPGWVLNPTTSLTWSDWCGQVLWSLLLEGNAYLDVIYSASGRGVASCEPLDPTRIQVHGTGKGANVYYIDGMPTTKIIGHIKGVMAAGSRVGLSPVEAARQSIGLGMAAQKYGSTFFDHDGQMPGVIELQKPSQPDQMKQLAEAWGRKLSKANRSRLPGVLDDGATWKPTTVSNEAAEFLSTRKFTAAEIAGQMFLLDPTELGINEGGSSLTYQNIEQRNIRKVQVTFLPWIIRIESFVSDLLAAPRYLKLNPEGLLRGDTLGRYQSYALGITNGFLTVDEARDKEDLPPMTTPAPLPAPQAQMALPFSEATPS